MRLAVPLALVLAAVAPRSGCGDGPPVPGPYQPCGGKACGASCQLCPPGDPDCAETAVLKVCDPAGQCLAGDVGSCLAHPDCAGKACGASCNPCGPDQVCPTLIPSACDPWGRCVGEVPGLCACVGKACGDACDPCDGLCMHPYASACDGTHRCQPVGSGVACGPTP